MSFADITTRPQSTNSLKLRFLNTSGRTVFRILDEKATKFQAHYVAKATIQCLGEECPVCENNAIIVAKNPNPQVYRKDPGYSPVIQRFAVNVLDKTLVKKCPNCETENPINVPNCINNKCNTFITGVAPEPSNRVKILQKGVKLFDPLNALNDAILNSKGDRIGLNNFDINLVSTGAGTNTTYTPIPSVTPEVAAGEEVPAVVLPEPLFDLDKAVLKLNRDEIQSLRSGVNIHDILVARQAVETPEPELVAPEPDTAVEEEARKQLEALLNQAKS